MGEKSVGTVFWLTGLSGAGKTTLAHALLPYMENTVFLDGDSLREIFGTIYELGFDADTRKKLGFAYARLCKNLSEQGFNVLIATICMFHAIHKHNREIIQNYCEIFIDVSEETRRKRDPKGLYKAQKNGCLQNMAGVDYNVELPENPTIYISENETLEQAKEKVLAYYKNC